MDDGTYCSSGGIRLATDGFTISEVNLLISALNSNFNVSAHAHKKNSSRIIYIPKSDVDALRPLLIQYIVPSMRYKLGLSD